MASASPAAAPDAVLSKMHQLWTPVAPSASSCWATPARVPWPSCANCTNRGLLFGNIIDEAEGCPSSSAFASGFGSLLTTYKFVGFTPNRDYAYVEINNALRRMHLGIVD